MSRTVILTGIRSNDEPHIGNYFGAIMPLIEMAKSRSDQYQINLFVPDLHSFTTDIDHSKLFAKTMSMLTTFVASGLPLDNPNVNIYRQSFVSAHSELGIILNNFTSFGELSRMTQFKEKGQTQSMVSAGLFTYPVLMAADILVHDATYVPVGDDQTQHLELTRNLAQRLNNKFHDGLFTVPLEVKKQHEFFGKDEGLRIMNLAQPTKKMSKSDESGKGVIFLSDDPDAAYKKIMSAATDSESSIAYDKIKQPGISNLLQILALYRNSPLQSVIDEYHGQSNYGQFKQIVAEATKNFLADLQARVSEVDQQELLSKLEQSERAMNHSASKTLLRVQKAIGLRR